MRIIPIPTSANRPVEYTPPSMDAETYRREAMEVLEEARASLSGERLALKEKIDAGELEEADVLLQEESLNRREEALDQRPAEIDREYRAIQERHPSPPVFLIRIPTSLERDQINSRLISLGLTSVTQDQIRATMIDELFERDWAAEPTLLPATWRAKLEAAPDARVTFNETYAEELANFLDGVWMRQEAHDAAIARFNAQEMERIFDELKGAPARPRAELPAKIISVREVARMRLIVDDMMATCQRLRDLAATNMDFSRRNGMLLARMHICPDVRNLTFEPPLVYDEKVRALTEESVDRLREQVPDQAWHELIRYIDGSYRLDGYEEGNSASPLGKPSGQIGLTGPSGDTGGNGGSSTESSIEQAPGDGSAKTTGRSSGSTSAPAGKKSSATQTGAASSSSPSG